jgi:hypothetical protein
MRKFLRHVKIVDLKHSQIDEEKSRPKDGVFFFKEKRYLDYKDSAMRPHFKYKFHRSAPYDISAAQSAGWDFVTLKDPVFPEGAILNAEKHWVFMDMVLMKVDLTTYLDYREEALDRSQNAVKVARGKFASQAASLGARAYTDSEVDALTSEVKVQKAPPNPLKP